MAKLSWRQLHDLKLSGISDYVEVWEKTNKKIGDNVTEANDTVEPGVRKAFGGIAGSGGYSAGAEAAKKQLTKLTSQLEDAKTEGAAIADIVRGAKEDFKRIRDEFRDKVDEINGTTPGIDGAGSFTVDLDNQVVNLPTKPSDERWNHQTAIEEWRNAYEPMADKFEEALDELILDAEDADEYASLLLKETSGDTDKPRFNGDPPDDLDPDVIEDGLPPKDASPEEVKDWWDSLSKDEQQYFIKHEPGKVGDLDGVPVTARDEANRIYLEDRPGQIDKEIKQLEDDFENGKISKIDYYAELAALSKEKTFIDRVDDSLGKDPGNGQRRYLIDIDPKVDQAVISTGNPDTADNLAVYVPGTDGSYYLGTQVGRADALQAEAANADPNSETAAVMWLGYDTPEFDLESPPTESKYAMEGGPKLNSFMDTMRTTHQGSPANTTVIGHSYGSSVVGTADAHGDGLGADNIVVAGSPGLGYDESGNEIDNVKQLNTDPDHVWSAAAEDDWIPDLGDPHGESPDEEGVGAEQLFVDTSGHSGYWDEGSQSLENQGSIITGNYDDVVKKQGT